MEKNLLEPIGKPELCELGKEHTCSAGVACLTFCLRAFAGEKFGNLLLESWMFLGC